MADDKLSNEKPSTSAKSRSSTSGVSGKESRNIWEDERFQHLVTDPRFKNLPREQRKVKIDKRFQGMFTDKKFQVKYTVDKYGRRVNTSTTDDLKKYYELDSAESESEIADEKSEADSDKDEAQEQRKEEKAISRVPDSEGIDENDVLESDGEVVPTSLKERLLDPSIDYARGEGRLLTDSSSDDESTDGDEDGPEMYIDHVWGELDADAETTNESTRRLAVCNMDWDRIRAADLMVLLSSFLQRGGSVLSVKIYLSSFGKERMAEEERHGPPELVGLGKEDAAEKVNTEDSDDSGSSDDELVQEQDSDAEEGDEYHMEKLRQYQLNRLRYYYAVVECDSVQTADKIYKECDGIEYESSATRVDLRFIPDETTFDDDEPTDICTELPDINSYKPRQFTTTALQQAKVDLTWDETALERRELGDKLLNGKLNEVSDKDLKTIVAFSSEEDAEESENDVNDKEKTKTNEKQTEDKKEIAIEPKTKMGKKKVDVIAKYKSLLAEINEKEQKEKNKRYEMEFTWDVKESKGNANDKDADFETKVKQELTPIEKVLQKRSEKNKKRKQERKKKKLQALGVNPDEVSSDSGADFLPDGIDMNDSYFAEEFAGGDFVDPMAKKKEIAKREKEKLKERQRKEEEEAERQVKELNLLLDEDELENEGKKHFSLEKILKAEQEVKSKRKRRKHLKKSKSAIADEQKEVEDNFKFNINDDRFNSIYTSHLFNIDPTDPHFKNTKGMERIIGEKLKRRYGDEKNDTNMDTSIDGKELKSKRPQKRLESALLIKSLKRKIRMET